MGVVDGGEERQALDVVDVVAGQEEMVLAFEAARGRAYASTHQMLRDTSDGFRYLERTPEGSRAVKTTIDTSQIFAAGGAYRDASRDSVVPLITSEFELYTSH